MLSAARKERRMNDRVAKNAGACQFSFLFLLLIIFCIGCGGKSQVDCTPLDLAVSPQTATADHAAAAPGNQISFIAFDGLRPGCPPTPGPIRTDLKWSVSDTVNTKIGNTLNVDYGVATCINATPSPVTVTATGTNGLGTTIMGTATLTCK
jgi:hypothetical protein